MKEKIMAFIEEVLSQPAGTINAETTMDDIEEWDSLSHVLLMGGLEEKLGISIPLDEAVEITSVREILEKAGV